MPNMEHVPVTSSVVMSIAHDEETKRMEVKFKNGKTYTIQNVSEDEYEEFLNAPSVGKHFNETYRGRTM